MSAQQPHDGRKLKELRQAKYPEWVKLQWVDAADGHDLATQYRGPGGEIISKHEFRNRVKSGEIRPVTPITSISSPAPVVAAVSAGGLSDQPSSPSGTAPHSPHAAPEPEPLAPSALELPDPQPRASGGRGTPGQASAAELALAATIGLVIISSLLAALTHAPELQMSEPEAQAIAVPLANLVQPTEFNRKFGRHLAGSSDYTLLGYALYAYGYRVVTQVAARQQQQAALQGRTPDQVRSYPYAVSNAAQPARDAPAQPAAQQPQQQQPARGGVAAGIVGDQAARIVGFNPLPNPRAS